MNEQFDTDRDGSYVHAVSMDMKVRWPRPMLCGLRAARYKVYRSGELARLTTPPAPLCPGCLAADVPA